jgi:hypothetical protein
MYIIQTNFICKEVIYIQPNGRTELATGFPLQWSAFDAWSCNVRFMMDEMATGAVCKELLVSSASYHPTNYSHSLITPPVDALKSRKRRHYASNSERELNRNPEFCTGVTFFPCSSDLIRVFCSLIPGWSARGRAARVRPAIDTELRVA